MPQEREREREREREQEQEQEQEEEQVQPPDRSKKPPHDPSGLLCLRWLN